MKKFLSLSAIVFLFASCAHAQFFKKDPLPVHKAAVSAGAPVPLIQNSWHPLVGVTALISDGTTLAGGLGVGFFHRTWDDPSQSWNTQYSISGLAFLDTKGSATGAIALGLFNIISVGPSYNFTTKKFGVITGVSFTPF